MPSSGNVTSSPLIGAKHTTVILPCKGVDCHFARAKLAPVLTQVGFQVTRIEDHQYGEAIKMGIRSATTPFILTMDADGQHSVMAAMQLHRAFLDSAYDLLIGQRPLSWSPRGLLSVGLNLTASVLAGRPVPDFGSGLRMMRRQLVEPLIEDLPDGFDFNAALTMASLLQRARVAWTPTHIYPRTVGHSHVRWSDGLTTLRTLWTAKARYGC